MFVSLSRIVWNIGSFLFASISGMPSRVQPGFASVFDLQNPQFGNLKLVSLLESKVLQNWNPFQAFIATEVSIWNIPIESIESQDIWTRGKHCMWGAFDSKLDLPVAILQRSAAGFNDGSPWPAHSGWRSWGLWQSFGEKCVQSRSIGFERVENSEDWMPYLLSLFITMLTMTCCF